MLTIDDSDWPRLQIRWHSEIHADEVEQLFARLDEYYARGERFGSIVDVRGARTSAATRSLMAKEASRQTPVARLYSVGTAVIVDSAVVRGALTALFWIYEPPAPVVLCGDIVEANDWLSKRLV